MREWIHRILIKLGLYHEPDSSHMDMPESDSNMNEFESTRGEASVRTKTIYPRYREERESFRFPLIPDEEKNPSIETVKRTGNRSIIDPPRPDQDRIVSSPKTRKSSTGEKKEPFSPTEIISPVFGLNRPNTELTTRADTAIQQFSELTEEEQEQSDDSKQDSRESLSTANDVRKESNDTEESESLNDTGQLAEVLKRASRTERKIVSLEFDVEEGGSEHSNKEQLRTTGEVIAFPQAQPSIQKNANTDGERNRFDHKVSSVETMKSLRTEDANFYRFPSFDLLNKEPLSTEDDLQSVNNHIKKLSEALNSFNVSAEVVGVSKGPTVTRFELQPGPGVKVNKFTNLIDDIKLALAAKDIRMEAPIPGRSAIGIEVPNEVSEPVYIRSLLESKKFQEHESPLAVALGRDIGGQEIIGDLRKMPHGLIAGSTGSGKSVCINSILVSLLYKAKPSDVRLILIDPKVVELAPYNHIPHLLTPVVTDPKQATAALKWAVEEMEERYDKFAGKGARDISRYNLIAEQNGEEKLPYILIVIDELADLMMVAPHDVEESISRIAQKARACGIHLLVATQRPSVDVITGLIKANIPTRIAFAVSSQADSRTILDMGGAERLLGKGDMLYYPSGQAKPLRLQGNFVSDEEIDRVVAHVKAELHTHYLIDKEELNRRSERPGEDFEDELFAEALLFTIEQGQASSSSLQRRFRIGYNRAARLIDIMEAEGFVSSQSGSRPRDVLISMEEYEQIFN